MPRPVPVLTLSLCLVAVVAAQGPVVYNGPGAAASADDWRRLVNANEGEQATWINSHLRAGMPPSDLFGMLILNRSRLTLPLIEAKIEEVLASPSPAECFTDRGIDPQNFVYRAAVAITEAGDVQALREIAKLIKIDDDRFGQFVEYTLTSARSYRNPFMVAYQALDLRDRALDGRISVWAASILAEQRPPFRNYGRRDLEPVPEFEVKQVRSMWADALAEKYKHVPTESEWALDPLVSRLESVRARVLREGMTGAVSEALQRRSKR